MSKKIYLLFDFIEDRLILASFDKIELFAKIGKDYLDNLDISSYRLKSVNVEDLKDEPN
jgi:hypothetical protein